MRPGIVTKELEAGISLPQWKELPNMAAARISPSLPSSPGDLPRPAVAAHRIFVAACRIFS